VRIREIFSSRIAGILGVEAIVLYPFILYRSDKIHISLRRHEWQHVLQIRELGALKFYNQYLAEFFESLASGMSWSKAYQTISFEEEDRSVERDGLKPWNA
jgi:hypothetical protein